MKIEVRKYIASQLKHYRTEKSLSLQDIAEQTGIKKDTISKYENASVSPTIDDLEKILNVFEIDFCIFFNYIYANKHKNNKGKGSI